MSSRGKLMANLVVDSSNKSTSGVKSEVSLPSSQKDNDSQSNIDLYKYDEKSLLLYDNFRALDNLLHNLTARRDKSDFLRIQEGFAAMNRSILTLENMNEILNICPEAFILTWEKLGRKKNTNYTLIVNVNHAWPEKNNNKTNFAMRLVAFKEKLNKFAFNLGAITNFIPPRPENSLHDANVAARNQINQISLTLDEGNYNAQTALSDVNVQTVQTEAELGSALGAALGDSEGTGSHIERMKRKILGRSEVSSEVSKRQMTRDSSLRVLESQMSLLHVLDCLHSHTSYAKTHVFALDALVRSLTAEISAHRIGVQYKDVYVMESRVLQLCETIPEYLSVLPADEFSNIRSLRINAYVSYGEVRKKMKVLYDMAKESKTNIENEKMN